MVQVLPRCRELLCSFGLENLLQCRYSPSQTYWILNDGTTALLSEQRALSDSVLSSHTGLFRQAMELLLWDIIAKTVSREGKQCQEMLDAPKNQIAGTVKAWQRTKLLGFVNTEVVHSQYSAADLTRETRLNT
jgi:hypothetical protein